MPHTSLHRSFALLILATCVGCTNYSAEISNQFKSTGRESIDLVKAVPSQWDRVCVLGPYMGNAQAEETLGFAWPVESRTRIEDNDGISLLMFVRGNSVVEYIEHPRNEGDFAELDGLCFKPTEAKFRRVEGLPDNWPRLRPANEA